MNTSKLCQGQPYLIVARPPLPEWRKLSFNIDHLVITPFIYSFLLLSILLLSILLHTLYKIFNSLVPKMDSLVFTYSRPAFQDEVCSNDEQQELIQATPPLSLKFAMPPMPNVRYT